MALASASQGLNPTLILIVIAAVVVAAFWQTILKVAIAALIIGFVFLLATGTGRHRARPARADSVASPSANPEEPG